MSRAACARRRRFACLASISAAAVIACNVPAPTLHDVRVPLAGGGHVVIGTISSNASLFGAAFAQSGETVTLDNVTVDLGFATYRMPKLEFVGSSMSRADLAALFDKSASEPLAARLSRLSAKSVTIPELRIEQALGNEKQLTLYRDTVLSDIVSGRVGAITSSSGSFEISGNAKNAAKGTYGRMTIANLDMALAASLFAEKAAGAQPAPMKPIYTAVSLDNMIITDPSGAEVRIARMAGKDFRARPAAESWTEAMRVFGQAGNLEKASPADRSRLFGVIGDLVDSFEVGSMEVTGIEIRDPKSKEQTHGRIARVAYTGAAGGQVPDARAEGMEIATKDGKVRIGTIAFTGFSFKPTFDGLKTLGSKDPKELEASDFRALIPTIGTMRFSGVEIDVPNEKAKEKDPNAENIRFALRDYEITADKPINGIPTNLRMAMEGLTFAVPPNSKEDGLKDLAAMGYRALDMSFVTAASWNEPGNELLVREVSVRGNDMGSVILRGTLGNVTRDAFSADSAVAMVALLGASAKTLDLTVENKGLFERLLGQELKKQKKSADELRREYGMAAAIAIPAMLGNSPSAKQLGQAVARFLAKPGKLAITARARDAAGLGLADVMSSPEPAAILDKLEITATAE